MRTICHANKFVKEASATSLMPSHEILMFAGQHFKLIQQVFGRFIICIMTACV